MARILIVEPDAPLLQTMQSALRRAGHEVAVCGDGKVGLEHARSISPDVLIVDRFLPGLDGLELTRAVRQDVTNWALRILPIVMVTPVGDEIARVVGLEVGADACLIKPFRMEELRARVRALLRRVEMVRPPTPASLRSQAGDVTADMEAHRVYCRGKLLSLRRPEFDLLVYFLRAPGQVHTREGLLEQVWARQGNADTRTVDVHIRGLRKKIEHDPTNPVRLQTIRRVGYAFMG